MPKAKKKARGDKDQITALMEAKRLIKRETENFKRRRQSRDATVDAIERIVDAARVFGAVQNWERIVDAPPMVPQEVEAA